MNAMDITEKRALKLGWDEVISIVVKELNKILGIQLQCKISLTEDEYWDVEFIDYRMPLPKLCQVLQAVEAGLDDWETVLPDEGAVDVKDLGMCAAEKLIGKHLNLTWEHRIIAEDGLWLVGAAESGLTQPKESVGECKLTDDLVQAITMIAERLYGN